MKCVFKNIIRGFFACIALGFVFSAYANTNNNIVMKIHRWKTANGATVYFVRVPSLPMLDVRAVFAAGSAYDGKSYGLASLTSSMIGEGSTAQNANQIAATFDRVGAKFNISAGRDMVVVSLRSLTDPKYLIPALATFSSALTKATFPLKALQREKNRAIAALHVEQQEPNEVASNAFYAAVYRKQAYAHQPLGTITSVKRLTREKVSTFYNRYYVARNASIVLVGDLTSRKAKKIARLISQGMHAGARAKGLKQAAMLTKPLDRHIIFPAKQTTVILGQVGITRRNSDYFPLIVGNYAFGGLPLSSILFRQVRDNRGLAYYAGSSFRPLRYRGPFIITFQTRANKAKEALAVVQQALKDYVDNGPTEAQLDAAKQNLIGSFPLALATNSDIAGVLTRIAFYHQSLNYLDRYRTKVAAVTREQVKVAFEKLIHPNKMVTILVGPTVKKTEVAPNE